MQRRFIFLFLLSLHICSYAQYDMNIRFKDDSSVHFNSNNIDSVYFTENGNNTEGHDTLTLGRTISIFGGSFVYNFCHISNSGLPAMLLNKINLTTICYGHSGSGFVQTGENGYTIVSSVEEATTSGATPSDIYLLWCSTNDFNYNKTIGSYNDYTSFDNFDESKKNTMCGAMNYCIKKISEFAPTAKILGIISMRTFNADYMYDTHILREGWSATFQQYMDAEKEVFDLNGIPYVELRNCFTPYNCSTYFYSDKLHPNFKGYERMLQMQLYDFLSQ